MSILNYEQMFGDEPFDINKPARWEAKSISSKGVSQENGVTEIDLEVMVKKATKVLGDKVNGYQPEF